MYALRWNREKSSGLSDRTVQERLLFPHSHHTGASRWRESGSLRAGCGEELQRDTPAGRIYAGTFFLIPGFVRRRESHFLCHAFQYHYPGELRIGKGYLPTNRTFQTPACRKTIRRHETKTGSELCTDSQAFHSVLGRTYHRCGPCIQKGVLGHAAEIETRRSYHHCGNALPERDECCDRIAFIREGKIQGIDTPDRILQQFSSILSPEGLSFNEPQVTGRYAIEVEGLTKQFGNFTAVDHISFKVKQGEIFGFLGANGAGKQQPCACYAVYHNLPREKVQ